MVHTTPLLSAIFNAISLKGGSILPSFDCILSSRDESSDRGSKITLAGKAEKPGAYKSMQSWLTSQHNQERKGETLYAYPIFHD
jgi:hypothetical protein